MKIRVSGMDDPRFLKIPRASKEDEDKEEEEELKQKEDPETVKKSNFIIPGHDETGAEAAFLTYDKIETQIETAYSTLKNEEDRETFEDYMIANLKIYFDQFEEEMTPSIEEPASAIATEPPPEAAPPEMPPAGGPDMGAMMPPAKRDDTNLIEKITNLLEI